jgi:uncharacterized protein YjiS (DUF1127 family)
MATTTKIDLSPDLRAQADRFFARMGQGFNGYVERLSRRSEVERLDAMSDAELAKLGITRDRIVAYVFRDKLGM